MWNGSIGHAMGSATGSQAVGHAFSAAASFYDDDDYYYYDDDDYDDDDDDEKRSQTRYYKSAKKKLSKKAKEEKRIKDSVEETLRRFSTILALSNSSSNIKCTNLAGTKDCYTFKANVNKDKTDIFFSSIPDKNFYWEVITDTSDGNIVITKVILFGVEENSGVSSIQTILIVPTCSIVKSILPTTEFINRILFSITTTKLLDDMICYCNVWDDRNVSNFSIREQLLSKLGLLIE